ncbi:uncharacterized protein PAC_03563 [Phialocephala subalpina]|uniref:Reverse transcriptase domain-containing protein n=1 Tax=Phialocephala subalpina TaxID=576137 RepID=A0A1L7WLP3_9HELO|nr:uncharacterized protein PAC_03563 [Phialocephala subalpina]
MVALSYRPIALLNTTGKVLEAIIATRLSSLVEAHKSLPNSHIGGKKRHSCELALHNLTTKVHEAWSRGKWATILSLDVLGAFDNVSHLRLLHSLKKRRVGGKGSNWVASFLTDETWE